MVLEEVGASAPDPLATRTHKGVDTLRFHMRSFVCPRPRPWWWGPAGQSGWKSSPSAVEGTEKLRQVIKSALYFLFGRAAPRQWLERLRVTGAALR